MNRTATAWLIRRFLDPGAELLFVEPERVPELELLRERLGSGA